MKLWDHRMVQVGRDAYWSCCLGPCLRYGVLTCGLSLCPNHCVLRRSLDPWLSRGIPSGGLVPALTTIL